MKIRFFPTVLASFSFTSLLLAHEHHDHGKESETLLDPALFATENLTGKIEQRPAKLEDGTEVLCWIIPIKSEPVEHQMGPWCPETVEDDASKAGKWFFKGELIDLDGEFIKNLAQHYQDNEWNLVNDDGSIRVTDTEEAYLLAARPNVDERYQNHCVECPADVKIESDTVYTIPVNPTVNEEPTRLSRGGVAVALNGVNFDPPAPVSAILAAHTIAALDDHGGHVNPHAGYHYHAATGSTKEVAQEGHAPLIGFVLDGFPLHAHLDEEGKPASDLDDCGGHEHGDSGYHYHAGAPGSNQIIKAFRGTPGTMVLPNAETEERGPKGGRPPHGPPPGEGPPPAEER